MIRPSIRPTAGSASRPSRTPGPLDTKRMETVDEEFLAAALDFIDRKHKDNTPWFCYFNPTRMHVWTHLKPASKGKTGHGVYPDGMVELDGYVGQLLKKLDDLGVADNTIVVFTTDNGAEVMSWPDGGTTPFRGEKATNWEGGYPRTDGHPLARHDPARHRLQRDVLALRPDPDLCAAGGDPDIVAKCQRGSQIGNKTFKVHLDGYNLMPFFKGEAKESPRREFLYWNDDGELVAIRVNDWKMVFQEQTQQRHRRVARASSPICAFRSCSICAPTRSSGATKALFYDKWIADRAFVQVPAQALAAQWLDSFKEFPIRQKPASFNLDRVIEKLMPK